MKDKMTERLEKHLNIKPMEDDIKKSTLPAMNVDVSTMSLLDMSAELQALYALANKGMEIQQAALEELDMCDKQSDKSNILSSATSALTASINAIDKATKLKLRIMKDYTPEDVDDDSITADRDAILDAIKSSGEDS